MKPTPVRTPATAHTPQTPKPHRTGTTPPATKGFGTAMRGVVFSSAARGPGAFGSGARGLPPAELARLMLGKQSRQHAAARRAAAARRRAGGGGGKRLSATDDDGEPGSQDGDGDAPEGGGRSLAGVFGSVERPSRDGQGSGSDHPLASEPLDHAWAEASYLAGGLQVMATECVRRMIPAIDAWAAAEPSKRPPLLQVFSPLVLVVLHARARHPDADTNFAELRVALVDATRTLERPALASRTAWQDANLHVVPLVLSLFARPCTPEQIQLWAQRHKARSLHCPRPSAPVDPDRSGKK